MCKNRKVLQLTQIDDDFEAFLSAYNAETQAIYRKAVELSTATIGSELLKLSEGATQQNVLDSTLFHLFRTWGNNFSKKEQATISKFVTQSYTFFRKDTSIFGDDDGIPKGTFNTLDLRTIEYYKQSDALYLGKFITDEDTKKKISDFIAEEYLNGTTPIGNNKEALARFKEKFGDVLDGEDWKIRRVLDTSLNRLRNSAALSYMDQAGVTEYQIVGIGDNRQSEFCRNIDGKIFSVSKGMDSLTSQSNSDPANISVMAPFGVSLIDSKDVKGTSAEDLENLGIGLPPYHGHCRTTIVAVL